MYCAELISLCLSLSLCVSVSVCLFRADISASMHDEEEEGGEERGADDINALMLEQLRRLNQENEALRQHVGGDNTANT
jgi:hypothetical protein